MNSDAWDGYAAERERVLACLNVPGSNPVVMAGDSHNAWAHELIDGCGPGGGGGGGATAPPSLQARPPTSSALLVPLVRSPACLHPQRGQPPGRGV